MWQKHAEQNGIMRNMASDMLRNNISCVRKPRQAVRTPVLKYTGDVSLLLKQ